MDGVFSGQFVIQGHLSVPPSKEKVLLEVDELQPLAADKGDLISKKKRKATKQDEENEYVADSEAAQVTLGS